MSFPALFRRRSLMLPSLTGWLVILLVCAACVLFLLRNMASFLIVNASVGGDYLVIEGWMNKREQTGAVTLIQRFGRSGAPGALNLNVHFHMLLVDGVYTTTPRGKSRFHRTNAPNQQKLTELVHTISHRVAGFLERERLQAPIF